MRRFYLTLSILLASVSSAYAQQQPVTPTAEQMVTRLRSQWHALLLASVANARVHGQNPGEYGRAIGKLVAPSWGKDVTPQRLARGMRANALLIGLTAELLEDTPEQATIRMSRPDSAAFETRFGYLGATLADYDEVMKAVSEQIAAEHGLLCEQHRDGNMMISKFTRRPVGRLP